MERAAHQILETPQVFRDPLALRIFGAEGVSWLGHNMERYRNPRSRAMRAFLVMRSRFAEDELAAAVRAGVRQYVVLGAGLDTFAYRNPHRNLRVFEVDHPSTQAWKRARLAAQAIDVPRSLRFAPVDFEKETLAAGLQRAGFRSDQPAYFSWLGVVIYLSKPAVSETLRYIAARPRGSQVVFDFALPTGEISPVEQWSRARSARSVAASGEAWINYYNAAALSEELRSLRFASPTVLETESLNARYFSGRGDGFQLYGSGRMMSAHV
jgi:methyltransferase (TIGR00027 family)